MNEALVPVIEAIKNKPIFLEIGSGFMNKNDFGGPVVFNKGFQLEPGHVYLGVDSDPNKIKKSIEKAKAEGKDNAHFANADGSYLAFLETGSVQTVYLANVLGSGYPERLPAKPILREAKRVLKYDGKLIIFENITPNRIEHPLLEKLMECGFKAGKRFTSKDPEFEKILNQYGIEQSWFEPFGAFILITGHETEEDEGLYELYKKRQEELEKIGLMGPTEEQMLLPEEEYRKILDDILGRFKKMRRN